MTAEERAAALEDQRAPIAAAPPPRPGTKPAFLPSDIDPTVFDEGFLRQLERLLLIMKRPVRGGLKGGRRSVKRGQSVEFADFRDYSLGDDLRQLDWNVLARLEKLFIKLYVEEEDVTIHFLLDTSASMAAGRPPKLQFAKRAAAALGYIGLASEDKVAVTALATRAGRRQVALRGSGRVFRLLAALSSISPTDGPTDLLASARHAGAQLTGRGVIVLLSDLLDPAADKVIRELAATGSELIILHVLSPDELDPSLEGDVRLVDVETGDGLDVTVDLATIDDYKARLAAWQEGFADLAAKRGATYVPISTDLPLADLVFAELRRRRVLGVSFLSPLALLGLLFVPVVLAMYLLKLRRDEQVVPSTLLWQKLLTDVEANAPWQRLRRSLLLLLQLLLVALLAILAARPFLERPAGLAGDVVVVIDTSASMGATDIPPDRLTEAKAQVLEKLRDLPANGTVSVIAAGRTARVVVNGTTDLGRVRAAIESITVSPSTGDLGDALNLADALAARAGDAEILVATDAALSIKPTNRLDHKVSVLQVGRERKNQAIVALAVRPAPSGVTRSVFVSVANLDIEPAQRRLEVYADDILIEANDRITLEAQTRTEVIIDDVPQGASVIEVRLTGGPGGSAPDALALDDRAWAVVPPDRLRRVLLVGEGDPYLETALSYLPNTELYGVTPAKYGPDTHPELFDLIIFEGNLPATLPGSAILAIAPPTSSDLGEVVGSLTDPGIGTISPDEPILKFVDLSSVHIGKATKLVQPVWARTVIPGPAGSPLLYTGQLDGRGAAVLAFLPRNSDLPLQVAFPVLMANLIGELLGGSAAPTEAVAPGDPVTIPLPQGATSLTVTRPDGTTVELAPALAGAASVAFSQTDLLGIYTATATFPTPTPGPSGPTLAPIATPTPGASAAPLATLAPGATATPVPTSPPANPNAPVRFAVDLFDPGESDISPGSPSAIVALGRQPGASSGPGASPAATPVATSGPIASGGTGGGLVEERPAARDELWVFVVLVVLVVLLAEWLVYHRDAVTRLWRGLRRTPAATGPNTPGGRSR